MNKKVIILMLIILGLGGIGGYQAYSKTKCNKAAEAIHALFIDEEHSKLSNKVDDEVLQEAEILINQVLNKEHKKHYLEQLQHAKISHGQGESLSKDDHH